MYQDLNFSKNWNNKLYCDFYTTFRVDSLKYKVGNVYQVFLKDKQENTFMHNAICVQKKIMKLEQINDFIAGLDAGTDAIGFKKIVETMYKNKIADIENADFCLCLMKRLKK